MPTDSEEAHDHRINRLVRANDSLFDQLTYMTARRRRTANELELIEAANFLYVEERRSLLQSRLELLTKEIDKLIRMLEHDDDAVVVILPAEDKTEHPSKIDTTTRIEQNDNYSDNSR